MSRSRRCVRVVALAGALLAAAAPPSRAEDDEGPRSHYILTAGYGPRGGLITVRDTPTSDVRHVGYRGMAYGFRIQENYKGPIYYLNKVWFAVATLGKGHDPNTGQEVVTAFDVGGGGGSWFFDIGPNYLAAGLDSRIAEFGASYLDLSLGIRGFRKFENDVRIGDLDPASDTARFLADQDAEYLVRNGGLEFFMLRGRYAWKEWGSGALLVGADISVVSLVTAPFQPFLSADTRDTLLALGFPRTSVTVQQHVGPLVLRARAAIPNAFVVVPWYVDGAELVLEAGLRL